MANQLANAIATMKAERNTIAQRLAELDQAINNVEGILRSVDPNAGVGGGEYEGLSIVEATTKFLLDLGKPATTREIAEALLAKGIRSTSKNFSMTVYAILRESKTIIRLSDNTWGFKEWKDEKKKSK